VPALLPSDAQPAAIASVGGRSKATLLIAEAARLAKLGEAAASVTVLVVGDAAEGQRAFLEEMRASASSLTKSAVANGGPALAILQGADLLSVPHQQLADVRSGADVAIEFEGWNLGMAIARFARGEEEVIA